MGYKVGSLLERIFEMMEIECLSDLKDPRFKSGILQKAQRLTHVGYSLDQWIYAFTYITGKEIKFKSVDELEEYIRDSQNNPGRQ